jgi:cytochrome c oxidase subunit IV
MTEHVVLPRIYYCVFAGLIALTLLTVALSFVELGAWHTVLGLGIGATKALLVGLFFMHLLYAPKMNWLALGAGLFWLAILLAFTLADYATRAVYSNAL